MAHDNGKSRIVDQIEADVVISNGTESLFLFISRIQESGTWQLKVHGSRHLTARESTPQ